MQPRDSISIMPPLGATPAAIARADVVAGDALYAGGQYKEALSRFQNAIRLEPLVADYHFRVATTAWKLDLGQLVEAHFQEAARLDPKFAEAHKMLAQWYVAHGRTSDALHHSGRAIALAPADADTIITRAVVLTADQQPDGAWQLLRPLVASVPKTFHLAAAYADIAQKIGHESQAVAFINDTIAGGKIPDILARKLHVLAASLLEATARHDEAFQQMRRAKKLSSDTFDAAQYSQWVSSALEYFSTQRMRSLPRAMHHDARPLLIVAMPRSGTSLIEQILASHPSVFGGGELRTLGEIANKLSTAHSPAGLPYPQCLELLSIRDADRLSAEYLAVIDSMNTSARYVTDKMPQNFEWLGLAGLILPHSRVIHCIRDPRDTCLSCLLTDFNTGNAFSNTTAGAAAYYRQYLRQMRHWKEHLTLPMLDVRYEEVVSDPAAQVRRILAFLDLPWDDRCLAFHDNTRPVNTASRDQVRRPMYTSSVGRWKRYENCIPELIDLPSF